MADDMRERLLHLLFEAPETWDLGFGSHCDELADYLIEQGVFLPPEGATKSEGRYVTLNATDLQPWNSEVTFDEDGRVYAAGYGEITEQYNEWLATLPGTNSVTFEWPEQ